MAVPNSLSLMFATASLANGLTEYFSFSVWLSSSSGTPVKPGSVSPITTFPQYLSRLVEVNTRYHLTCHVALWASCVWSLIVEKNTRTSMTAVLAFEFGAMAVAGWIMAAVDQVYAAKTKKEVEAGVRLLMRRQMVRYVTTHAPPVVLCLYTLASR